jgi:hypothetical protein
VKNYLAEMVDLQGDSYLNPGWPGHNRANNSITHIAVHHDAMVRPHEYDSVARYRGEAREHYNRLGPGLQYHYKIDNAGGIFKIRPHSMFLYAVGSDMNYNTINICLDGYFHTPHNQQPTREQYEALIQLLNKLTNETPEIPATGSTVCPHSFFSGTACCGDTLRPFVNQWRASGGVNESFPDVPFDWPEYQPSAPAPTPTPTPTPPADTRPEWERNFEAVDAIKWTEGTGTVIDVADNNKTLTTLADNTKLDIGGKTKLGGTEFFITKYWTSRKVYNKVIPAAQLKDTADEIPVPTPPVVVPPADQDHEARLSALEKLVKLITDFLDKVFKDWRK